MATQEYMDRELGIVIQSLDSLREDLESIKYDQAVTSPLLDKAIVRTQDNINRIKKIRSAK